jgi:hypothetical protein
MTTASPEVLAAARASGRKLPDFFIVGHPKSGTTALYEMLRRHSQIYMPELKETLFFDRELHPGVKPTDPQPNTLEEYLDLFADAREDQRAGEASPSYLRSHTAAARIAELQPKARIIAILREPADFLRSMHLELLKNHQETEKTLRGAMAREERMGDRKPVLRYSMDRVEYVAQLRRYRAVFAAEQVLVLIYDDFRVDNEGAVRRVLRFLDVDDSAPIALTETNQAVQIRSPRLHELVRSLYLGEGRGARVVGAAIKAVTPQRLRHSGLRAVRSRLLYGRPQPPEEAFMLELRRRFKGEVVALSEYLDRDLVRLWGYDRVG